VYPSPIFPLLKKDGLPEKAKEIKKILENKFRIYYDESGSIGKRYARQDANGTPYCITVDHQTLEDNTVTIRERDSLKQIRINANEFVEKFSICRHIPFGT
jgi:glycyl-tRNA synthetase